MRPGPKRAKEAGADAGTVGWMRRCQGCWSPGPAGWWRRPAPVVETEGRRVDPAAAGSEDAQVGFDGRLCARLPCMGDLRCVRRAGAGFGGLSR
jgi:hypothetical protein